MHTEALERHSDNRRGCITSHDTTPKIESHDCTRICNAAVALGIVLQYVVNDWPPLIWSVKKLMQALEEPAAASVIDDVEQLLEVEQDGNDSDCGDVEGEIKLMSAAMLEAEVEEEAAKEIVQDLEEQMVTTAAIIALQDDVSISSSANTSTAMPSAAIATSSADPASAIAVAQAPPAHAAASPAAAIVPEEDTCVEDVSIQSLAFFLFGLLVDCCCRRCG